MTRRDYSALASYFKQIVDTTPTLPDKYAHGVQLNTLAVCIGMVGNQLAADNPRFDLAQRYADTGYGDLLAAISSLAK